MERYHRALMQEIRTFAAHCPEKLELDTIYIGGGTPSTYPDELLLDMSGTLNDVFKILPTCEFTLEVNPGTVRPEQYALWRQAGINRLSIGVQSLNDKVLKNLNRHQSVDDVFTMITQAQPYFDNLSADLIIGLPDVTDTAWQTMVHTMMTLPLKHISIYFLTVHEDTPLYFKVKTNKVALPRDEGLVDLYNWSVDCLAQHGFERYEISNFARPGYASRHNQVYWQHKPYKAFGIGACSFDGAHRFANEKNIVTYMQSIEQGGQVVHSAEQLTDTQIYMERVMLGIRQAQGVAIADLLQHLTCEQQATFTQKVAWLKEHDFVRECDGRMMLTPRGLAVENTIALQLTM